MGVSFSFKSHLPVIFSSILIFLFVYTGSSKWIDHVGFLKQLKGHPLLHKVAGILSWAIPVVELGVALMLLFVSTRTAGLYASLVLLLIFTIYLVAMLMFSQNLPCSCGGVVAWMSWHQHILFNGLFICMASIAIVLTKHRKIARSITDKVR